ncbi:MAG: phenylalanine--tRNA ligase subunit alpha [bacterium]|nr:phenylalanine--tRNA ligase subunit alpha [bacterium]
MKQKLADLARTIEEDIAKTSDLASMEDIRIKHFGKKSELLEILKNIKNYQPEERPVIGQVANKIKNILTEKLNNKKINFQAKQQKESLDSTLDGNPFVRGSLHPITTVKAQIVNIFQKLGFGISEGPDMETDYYNFTSLNFPHDHPARDEQDTFFLDKNDKDENKPLLLRTHTSPVQIRYMKAHKPPFQIVVPGTVYRSDSDVSHTPMFHQVEGLAVGENITFANLKWILSEFLYQMFGSSIDIRFRPSFFPFTEPSVEVDISCVICGGTGCRVCKNSGWLEILGAGMVHPNVFKSAGYDPEYIQGFAFGMGVERVAMLKYEINDIRLFYENDLRFLKQFR